MLGKLSVALLMAASPVPAAEPAPAEVADAEVPATQEYTTKKVCRTVEVAGSLIPRRSCVTKKVPVKKPTLETEEAAKSQSGAKDETAQEQKQ